MNWSSHVGSPNPLPRPFACSGKPILEALFTLNLEFRVSSMGKGIVEVSTCDGSS
jgi:hypothetical protein